MAQLRELYNLYNWFKRNSAKLNVIDFHRFQDINFF